MPTPWTVIDRAETSDGPLELRSRNQTEWMILHAGRVLMSSRIHRSELAVAELGCAPIASRKAPRVLIGGLGLGFTLRAALDALPPQSQVVVAELNEAVVRWCQGPVAAATKNAVRDKRVKVLVDDVTRLIRAAASGKAKPYDAIVVDLYVGPMDARGAERHALYGTAITEQVYAALTDGGIYAVWGEERSKSFEARLSKAGFDAQYVLARGGGPRHAVYVAEKKPQRFDKKKPPAADTRFGQKKAATTQGRKSPRP